MRILLRLVALLRPSSGSVALAILLGCVTVISSIGLLATAAFLIAAAALQPLIITLTLPIYIVRVSGVMRALSRYAERLVSHDVTFRLLAAIRVWFYTRLAALAPARLLQYRSGDLLARIVKDVDELENVYIRALAPLVVAVLIVTLTGVLLSRFSPTLALVTLAFLLVAGIVVPVLAGLCGRVPGAQLITGRSRLHNYAVDVIQGLQDILACGRAADWCDTLAGLDGAARRAQRRMALVSGMQRGGHDLLTSVALWSALVVVIPLVSLHRLDPIYLAALALVVLGVFDVVQPIGQASQALGRSLSAAGRLYEVIDAAPAVVDRPAPVPAPTAWDLAFDHVSFSYDGRAEHAVLEDMTFAVGTGRRIAIVGPSGAGKSTLVQLLLRTWDPRAGAIRLGGHGINAYTLADLRAAIGLVAQDTHLMSDTVRANLLLAKPDATDDEIERALAQAQLSDVVRRLPDGLDTWIGEQGLRLSGGERQRLAVARVLLKDAPVVVLDEATANLDPVTERDLLDVLYGSLTGRTMLVVTHRLIDLDRMDEIVVLDKGRIVERGTHRQLMLIAGLYHRMVSLQEDMLPTG